MLASPTRRIAAMIVAALIVGVGLPAPAAVAEESVVVNPEAARQRTVRGRTIHTLKAWQGKLYSGYGDYDANTGPISITAFDPATRGFAVEFVQDTEEISRFREIGGALYSPSIDPRCCNDFAVRTAGPGWSERNVAHTYHVYDMAKVGSDLFMSGSTAGACQVSCGAVWRSGDGGTNWAPSFTEDGRPGSFRCLDLVALQSKVYVECTSGRYVLEADRWSPMALDVVHPSTVVFDQRIIAIDSNEAVFSYDGSTRKDMNRRATMLTTAGGKLYAFHNGSIYATSDLDSRQCSILDDLLGSTCSVYPSWSWVGNYRSSAASVAVLDGYAYSGDRDARIYRSKRLLG